MLPAQREFYQFVAIIVIDILTGPSKPTNFLQREETMPGPEFCVGVRAKFYEEFMSVKSGRNGHDLMHRAFNFTTDPMAFGEFLHLSHKFITILQAGFFSPDFVTAPHPFKIKSNRTGKMTNKEFCDQISGVMRTTLEDAILNGHMDHEPNINIPKVLAKQRIREEVCDDIVRELNDFKSSPIWDRLNNMVRQTRIFEEEEGWEVRLVDETRRMASLTTCLLEGMKSAVQDMQGKHSHFHL